MEAKEAFSTLLKLATQELEMVQREGAAYFTKGDTTHVRDAADRVEKIQSVLNLVNQLHEQWGQAIPEAESSLPPSQIDTNQSKPPSQAIHEIDSPQSHHILHNFHERTPPGQKTPQESYYLPILRVLIEMGGKGRAGKVIDRVGKIMDDVLNNLDLQQLPGRNEIRWRNTAAWARNDLVKMGCLSDRSPNGTWEITEAGSKYLNNRK